MISENLLHGRKEDIEENFCYELNTPMKKVEQRERKNKYQLSSQRDNYDKNDFILITKKDVLDCTKESPSWHVNNLEPVSENYGTNSSKNFNFTNLLDETKFNFTEGSQTPKENLQFLNPESCEKEREKKKKVKIEKLIESYKTCKKTNEEYRKEIEFLRRDKVEYEEIVYELKTENLHLKTKYEKINTELEMAKSHFYRKALKHALTSGVLNINVSESSLQKSQYFVETEQKIQFHQETSSGNHYNLETILNDMKKKLSHYEKQIAQKETLNNHQFYLLEKLRNEQNQLNHTQTSLLEELEFVLTKNKKLKRENEEIKYENEERVKEVIELEEINVKLENEVKELTAKIKEFEASKNYLKEKFVDETDEKKEPENMNFMEMEGSDELLPESLTDNLNEICEYLDRKEKTINLQFNHCICLQILPNLEHHQEKFISAKEATIEYNEVFLNEMKQKDLKILNLEEELKEAQSFEKEMEHYLQHSKLKLTELAKELELLSFENQSLKIKENQEKHEFSEQNSKKDHLLTSSSKINEELKIREFNRNLSFIEEIYDDALSIKTDYNASLCFNDKFEL